MSTTPQTIYPQTTFIQTNVCMCCGGKPEKEDISTITVPPPVGHKYDILSSLILHCQNPECTQNAQRSARIIMGNRNTFYLVKFDKFLSLDTTYIIPRSDGTVVKAKICDPQLIFLDGEVYIWVEFTTDDKLRTKGVAIDVLIKHNQDIFPNGLHLTVQDEVEFRKDFPDLYENIMKYFKILHD